MSAARQSEGPSKSCSTVQTVTLIHCANSRSGGRPARRNALTNPPPVTVSANTSHSTQLSITNTGNVSGATALTCVGKLRITCGTITPANITLAPGAEGSVTVNRRAGACCTSVGRVILNAGHGGGSGTQQVTIQ